jgi:cathepsin B
MGCSGGNLYMTWLWMESFGIALDSCVPYTSGKGDVAKCSKTCTNTETDKKKAYVKFLSIEHHDSPDSIKQAIYESGPIETGFTVYQDFMSYKSGIYKHTTGSRLGGHAVKIVGWGNENGEDYWIVANSWNTTWGEDGFFKIAFGQCGIDADGISGTPNVSDWEKN